MPSKASIPKPLKKKKFFSPLRSGPEGSPEPFGAAGVSATSPLGPGEEGRRYRPAAPRPPGWDLAWEGTA